MTLYFIGDSKQTLQMQKKIYESPISQELLPKTTVQKMHYKAGFLKLIVELKCDYEDTAQVIQIALASSGVLAELTKEQFDEYIASGEYK